MMIAEKLPYGNRIYFVYINSEVGENSRGFLRPMCIENTRNFEGEEALFENIYNYLKEFEEHPVPDDFPYIKERQCISLPRAKRFYVVEIYYSQRESLQGFIRGREYPLRKAFRNKEEFCRLLEKSDCIPGKKREENYGRRIEHKHKKRALTMS